MAVIHEQSLNDKENLLRLYSERISRIVEIKKDDSNKKLTLVIDKYNKIYQSYKPSKNNPTDSKYSCYKRVIDTLTESNKIISYLYDVYSQIASDPSFDTWKSNSELLTALNKTVCNPSSHTTQLDKLISTFETELENLKDPKNRFQKAIIYDLKIRNIRSELRKVYNIVLKFVNYKEKEQSFESSVKERGAIAGTASYIKRKGFSGAGTAIKNNIKGKLGITPGISKGKAARRILGVGVGIASAFGAAMFKSEGIGVLGAAYMLRRQKLIDREKERYIKSINDVHKFKTKISDDIKNFKRDKHWKDIKLTTLGGGTKGKIKATKNNEQVLMGEDNPIEEFAHLSKRHGLLKGVTKGPTALTLDKGDELSATPRGRIGKSSFSDGVTQLGGGTGEEIDSIDEQQLDILKKIEQGLAKPEIAKPVKPEIEFIDINKQQLEVLKRIEENDRLYYQDHISRLNDEANRSKGVKETKSPDKTPAQNVMAQVKDKGLLGAMGDILKTGITTALSTMAMNKMFGGAQNMTAGNIARLGGRTALTGGGAVAGGYGGYKLGEWGSEKLGLEAGGTGEKIMKYGGAAAGAIGVGLAGTKIGKMLPFLKNKEMGNDVQKVYVTNASDISGGGVSDLLPDKISKGGISSKLAKVTQSKFFKPGMKLAGTAALAYGGYKGSKYLGEKAFGVSEEEEAQNRAENKGEKSTGYKIREGLSTATGVTGGAVGGVVGNKLATVGVEKAASWGVSKLAQTAIPFNPEVLPPATPKSTSIFGKGVDILKSGISKVSSGASKLPGASIVGKGIDVLKSAGGVVSNTAKNIPGSGLIGKAVGKVGVRGIPLLGGALGAGLSYKSIKDSGGSTAQAVGGAAGSGIGGMLGGAAGALGGPVVSAAFTMGGSLIGEYVGKKLGGLFSKRDKTEDEIKKEKEDLLQKETENKLDFWDKLTSSDNPFLKGIGKVASTVRTAVSAGATGFREAREKGGSFLGSLGAGVGAVAARFEGGKGGAGTISSGAGDFGGKSYGTYQLSSKQGSIDPFLKKSGYAEQFKGLQTGTPEFDAKWKEIARKDPKFADAQQTYAKEKYASPQLAKLQKMGVDTSNRAVQEMAMSTGVQYGADTGILEKALKGKDASKMSPTDIINAVQDHKVATVGTRFASSSAQVQAGVAKRHGGGEREALLSLVNQTVDQKDNVVPQTATNKNVPAPQKLAMANPPIVARQENADTLSMTPEQRTSQGLPPLPAKTQTAQVRKKIGKVPKTPEPQGIKTASITKELPVPQINTYNSKIEEAKAEIAQASITKDQGVKPQPINNNTTVVNNSTTTTGGSGSSGIVNASSGDASWVTTLIKGYGV